MSLYGDLFTRRKNLDSRQPVFANLNLRNPHVGFKRWKMYVFRERMEWFGSIYGHQGAINVSVGEWEKVSSKYQVGYRSWSHITFQLRLSVCQMSLALGRSLRQNCPFVRDHTTRRHMLIFYYVLFNLNCSSECF